MKNKLLNFNIQLFAEKEDQEVDYVSENLRLLEEIKKLKAQNAQLYNAVVSGNQKKDEPENKEKEEQEDFSNEILDYLKKKNKKKE